MLVNILLLAVVYSALASPEQNAHVLVQKPRYSPAEAVSSQSYVRHHPKSQVKYEIPNLRHVVPIQQKEVPSRVQYITPAPEKYFVPAQQSYPSSTPTPHVNNFLPAVNHQQYPSSSPDLQQYSISPSDVRSGIQYVQQYQVQSSNENHPSESKVAPQAPQVVYKIPVYTRYTQVGNSKESSNDGQGQTQAIFSNQNEEANYHSQPELPTNAHYATQASAHSSAAIATHSAQPNAGHYSSVIAGHSAQPNSGQYATSNAGHYATQTNGHYATQAASQYATPAAVNFAQPATYVKYAPETVVKVAAQQPQEVQYPKYRLVYASAPAVQQESIQQHSVSPSPQTVQQQYSNDDRAQEAYNIFASIKAAQYQPDDSQNYKIALSTKATPVYQKSAYPQQQQAIQYYHQ